MGRTVVCVVGTRPEAVKMAPVVLRLREIPGLAVRIVATGQHRALLEQALNDFALVADRDLGLMRPDQNLADLTARALVALSAAFAEERPDLVLAQGDTTSVLAAALASYYQRIPFGHIEAGLRTGKAYSPFPEEKNRVVAGHLADLHFAPTSAARANLLREGIHADTVHVTGNPVIDALLLTARQNTPLPLRLSAPSFLLVTAHRRESFGEPLQEVCAALLDVVARHPVFSIVFSVHPNPQVREIVHKRLGGQSRIHLIEPVAYRPFVALMKAATLVLTDSGGVQEEAPALGKPVLVLREETERPEAVAAGAARLVGTNRGAIVAGVEALLDRLEDGDPTPIASPYGDGRAAERIARIVADRLGVDPGPTPVGLWDWPARQRASLAPACCEWSASTALG